MGRWGDKIYESDLTLDYFARIRNVIMREIYYLLSPEQVRREAAWVREVLTVFEIMLLFDKNAVGSIVYLIDEDQAVKRWREVFFSVWDAEWDDTRNTLFPFHAYAYRQEHRQTAIKWFDRLGEVAAYLRDYITKRGDLREFTPEEKLPYFSLTYSKTSSGEEYPIFNFFLGDLIKKLVHSIVFVLSDENREMAIGFFDIEEVWVDVDIMVLLCESYSISPSVTSETVEIWHKKMIDIWKTRLAMESIAWIEDDDLYKNAINIFDKLRTLAQKYPPMFA